MVTTILTTLLLDSHAVIWWSVEPRLLRRAASQAIADADELAVAALSWFELAWPADYDRIVVPQPVRAWLKGI